MVVLCRSYSVPRYLHSLGAVHRDLAARNCLVSADDEVRIGDFGLSRVKFPGDYHPVEGADDPLPVRWMAPGVFVLALHVPSTSACFLVLFS